MRILLTGAEGQLGQALISKLQGTSYLATDQSDLDITNPDKTFEVIRSFRPQAVIHCAAYTNVDKAESDSKTVFMVNAVGTQNVATACLGCDAKMVYVSTDYVFDGKKGYPYAEYDLPNPINVYGKSKLFGEMVARQTLNRLFIARTSWLYGNGNNFVRTMLKIGQQRSELQVVNDQFGCPSYAGDVADALLRLVETNSYGIYHVTNRGITNWYSFAQTIFKIAGFNHLTVSPVSSEGLERPALRPVFSALDSIMLEMVLDHGLRKWESALEEYISQEMCSSVDVQRQVP